MTFKKGYKQTEQHRKKISEALAGRKFNDKRKEKLSFAKKGKFKIRIDERELYELYINQKKIIRACAIYFNCSEGCIKDRLKIYGIKIRTKSEAKMGELNPMYGKKQSLEHIKKRIPYLIGHRPSIKAINFLKSRKGQTYEEFYGKEKAKELKELISKAHKESEKNKLHMALLRAIRKTLVLPKKDTKIEVKIQNFLKELQIPFFTHQYMNQIEHSYQCDILIPNMKMVIECDGDYWHKYPIGLDKDHIRTKELIEKGFKVLRLWENEIKIMDLNKFKEVLKI